MMYNLLLLLGIFISGVKCGYYYVTAPNIIRFDNEETIVVGVFGLQNAHVKVWLQHGEKRFSEIDVEVINEKAPMTATVKVTENDLFGGADKAEEKPRKIKICSKWNGETRSRELILSYRTGFLIVQTDKPIYTPQKKVSMRTLALDEALKAVDGWQVRMDIVEDDCRCTANVKWNEVNIKTVTLQDPSGKAKVYDVVLINNKSETSYTNISKTNVEIEKAGKVVCHRHVECSNDQCSLKSEDFIFQPTHGYYYDISKSVVIGARVAGGGESATEKLFAFLGLPPPPLGHSWSNHQSPSNLTMGRKRMKKNSSGFYEHDFDLPPYPEKGIWTARAFYDGQFETESRSLFEVREYVLPTYGVTIEVDTPFILQDTAFITVVVRAEYVYGKPVDGKARLTLNLVDENGISEYILNFGNSELQISGDGSVGSAADFVVPVTDILNSKLLREKDFPDGKRLEVVATVLESATGKEEARSHTGTIFAIQPYSFKFTRSKLNFRPGWVYYVYVNMLYANGEPVTKEKMKVKMFINGELQDEKETGTDSKGQAFAEFETKDADETITFRATSSDDLYWSEPFNVKAYGGSNQVQVDYSVSKGKGLIQALTNTKGTDYTGMLFIVVTRGKIVYTKFKERTNQATVELIEELQEIVTPTARVLVFYVDKGTHQLVADSNKFEVEKKCRGVELNLETDDLEVPPGGRSTLTVNGVPFTWVGLNVIDKALLLLNDKNVLRKNQMFDALQSHDLGCGEGGGASNGEVFKKTGLTILTNAMVDENDIARDTGNCEGKKKRRKREEIECKYHDVDYRCCTTAVDYVDVLMEDVRDGIQKMPTDHYFTCYSKARNLSLVSQLPSKCIMAYFFTCKEELEARIFDNSDIISKSLGDDSVYATDLARLVDAGIKAIPRTDFRESWLFEVEKLDNDGTKRKILNFPHSITKWKIQAIGITPDQGICIADEIDVVAKRKFFIQLYLPYKAIRLEHFDVKATIFNYGKPTDENIKVRAYLDGVDNLCYTSEAGMQSPAVSFEMSANSAKTVRFPMIPLRTGEFPVKLSAFVVDGIDNTHDIIQKDLYVVYEGVEEQIAINVCLDPKNQKEDCRNDPTRVRVKSAGNDEKTYKINLSLPGNSITKSGGATAYIQSNVMTNIVQTIIDGVESLIQLPAGCGEQTMIRLSPTVSAMVYLKQTKKVTDEIEILGNRYIRDGVNREVSQFRHADGSYAAWQNRASSTWVTAFVAKVFCQAKKVVDDAVDEQDDLQLTIDWLRNHMEPDGSFIDDRPVINREIIGQMNERDPSLTAFVLITLQECGIHSAALNLTIAKAMKYLEALPENMLRNNPFLLAISTYALALSNSNEKYRFKDMLHDIRQGKKAVEKDEDMHWGNPGGKPASAQSVETTSYALLAMLQFGDIKRSGYIVRWLTSQRDAKGSFRTTQDTVIGLQALSEYGAKTHSADIDLKVTFTKKGWKGDEAKVTKENATLLIILKKLPVESPDGDNGLTVKVIGTGSAIMTIDLRYNRPATQDESCPFEVSPVEVEEADNAPVDFNLAKERGCDICGRCELDPEEPDYEYFASSVEIESNFGRRKKRANRQPRATSTKICIRFSVSSKNEKDYGMSIVNFGLETGMEVVKEDLDKLLEDNSNIARYEMPPEGGGFIVFYLNEVTSVETKFIFRLNDTFGNDASTRRPSSVKVYDYYHPDRHCTVFYGTDANNVQSVDYQCDKNKLECSCVDNTCMVSELDVWNGIKNKAFANRKNPIKPALLQYRYTCDSSRSTYGVHVKIEEVGYNIERSEKFARGTVVWSFHQGIENLEKDDEMTFVWNLNCEYPNLEVGKSYYIFGKEGIRYEGVDSPVIGVV